MLLSRLRYLLTLTQSQRIARRYLVTNGFDGVLAMLGLLMGFRMQETASLQVMVSACLGATVALFTSGITSAYISETAEKRRELRALEKSMVTSLEESAHAQAARLMPWLVALVNGLAPLFFSLLILLPLLLASEQLWPTRSPIDAALGIALLLCFLLGVYLGRLSDRFWLWSGLRALLIALLTALIIFMIQPLLEAR